VEPVEKSRKSPEKVQKKSKISPEVYYKSPEKRQKTGCCNSACTCYRSIVASAMDKLRAEKKLVFGELLV
jgi:hypothetical protein